MLGIKCNRRRKILYRKVTKFSDTRKLRCNLPKIQTKRPNLRVFHQKDANGIATRIDVYETLCPQQMLVHKGGKIKNWGGECRDVTPTKSLSQNIRVDVNREVKFL